MRAMTGFERGLRGRGAAPRHCNKGRPYAKVLPEPVSARTRTSLPDRTAGIACDCTVVGVVRPDSTSTRLSSAFIPRSENELSGEAGGGSGGGDSFMAANAGLYTAPG